VWSHQFGFELRLLVDADALPRTQVVCSYDDLIRVQPSGVRRSRQNESNRKPTTI
jgi:hypothetical protein